MAHILFVNDLPPQVENYIRTLEDKGHAVTLKKNAADALATLDAHLVDLLVLDIHGIPPNREPQTDIDQLVYGGLELYRKVRKNFPRLKIIILSIYSEYEIKMAAETSKEITRFTRTLFLQQGEYEVVLDTILYAVSLDDHSPWPITS